MRSAIPYGCETWCVVQNDIGILQKTERAMVRSMCGVKLMGENWTRDLMQMLHLNETLINWQELIVSVGMDMY